jgi:glutathione S-transferase
MEYLSVPEARKISGLRIVLSPGGPGPWSEAAKSICYLKKLSYIPVAQEVGGPNPELYEWTAQTSAPAVIWNDERPRNLWNDQLFLFERLAPDPPMMPGPIGERALMFGYANEICGENGFAWNRRLLQFHYVLNSPKSSPRAIERFGGGARKYLYSQQAAAKAPARCAGILGFLADRLESQRARGSRFFIGDRLTALDIYWATFATLIEPLPHEINPMQDGLRRLYTNTDPVIAAAVRPVLMEHREMMYRDHLPTPLDF